MARIPTLLLGLLCAALASQAPAYLQDYTQRLGGAIDELSDFVKGFDADAAALGLSREEASRRLASNEEPFAARRGRADLLRIERHRRLVEARTLLTRAGPFDRPFVFLATRDPVIAARAIGDFEPAIPATTEGAAYAATGFAIGLIAVRVLMFFLTLPFRLVFRRARS